MAEPLVLINVFEVPAGEAEQFIAAWEKISNYLRSQPGYIDTALHQAISPDADFQFVNVAHWRTAEEFLAATQRPEFLDSAVGLVGYTLHPSLYRVVRT
jgi:heme-degrading monooxygenase HmoA